MSESPEKARSGVVGEEGVAAPDLASAVSAFVGKEAEAADETPTIISKPAPQRPRPEESFAAKLQGRKLAHFQLIEPIGIGGMAAVIRALDTQLDRVVALKILPPEMAADPENIRRFQQEARAAAKLDHENIARAFYFGDDQGLHFIAFEFVQGENLRVILERRKSLTVAEAVHYLLQIATGLAHAAERGVVHRDIKPSNIIIGPNGRAKLVDMGLARNIIPVGDELTQSGVTLGTFDYISPEQALEPRQADARSDIYSLGCTFYQILTGQSPVPDGTAAKKLHHHQHVLPADPRQLNPEVPDELAAILSRMMAKNPNDRYQKPEHLMQHLLPLAQRYGQGGGELPTLRLEASLPGPPQLRPLYVAGASLVLLLLFVALHGMSSWQASTSTPPTAFTSDSASSPRPDPPPIPDPQVKNPDKTPPTVPPVLGRAKYDARTPHDLAAFLDKKHAAADVFLVNDLYDLGDLNASLPGLHIQGAERDVVLQPKNPKNRPTLRLAYRADYRDGVGVPAWNALTVRGSRVTLRGLRLEVDATQAPHLLMAGVKLQDGGVLKLEQCEFVQYDPPSAGRLSDVFVEGARPGGPRPVVLVSDCSFRGGQNLRRRADKVEPLPGPAAGGQFAVTVSGSAVVQLSHCAFGPHAAFVHLRDRGTPPSDITLRNCSGFLVEGAVFQLEDGASAHFLVQNSLLSRPDQVTEGNAVLISQEGQGTVHYNGLNNRYHNFSAFWVKPQDRLAIASHWEEFQSVAQIRDDKSSPLGVSPWTEKNPLQALERNQTAQAFQADVKMAELRQNDAGRMVGLEHCVWGEHYGKLPLLDDKRPELLARKIVDPTRETGGGFYKSLGQALLDAKPGDRILIKHTGTLPVEPVRLDKAALDVTLRPFPGYQPILSLGDTTDKDAALFRIHDSKLKLEQLEFLLRPRQQDFKAQAVVSLAGLGQCLFKSCVITLDAEPSDETALAVVTLADPRDVMKMEPPPDRETPEVRFENCFVRGKGDLVAVRASRPFDLKADHCLFALSGSFLVADGNSKEPPAMPVVQLSLSHVTAYLSASLAHLRTTKSVKELVPTQVRASDCLFAAAGGEQTLLRFAGDLSDEHLARLLFWNGMHNAYSGFRQMLDQQPRADEVPLTPYGRDKWEDFTRERDGVFERIKFAAPPTSDAPLARVLPLQFKVKTDFEADPGYGADLSRLPRPTPDSKADSSFRDSGVRR